MTTDRSRPGVLMVTGAYPPELSGGGLQCRTMIHALRDRLSFEVLTTCTDPALPRHDDVDGVPVTRVFVDVGRPATKAAAAAGIAGFFLRRAARFRVVHLHGYSSKSALVTLLARASGKRVVLTLHTAGHDEPDGARRFGRLAAWCYGRAHLYLAISPGIAASARAGGVPADRLRVIPNGIDVERFRPPSATERAAARAAFGLTPDRPWILFVGFFSREKAPDVMFDAWLRLAPGRAPAPGLLFVGATESAYHEVDPGLARAIRERARALGVEDRVRLAGPRHDVEQAYRAADVFAMPSTREAFGMALVEAMASGLPVVASRIAGVTDTIVDDGVTGALVMPGDAGDLAAALARVLADPAAGAAMGLRARAAVVERYGVEAVRRQWLEAYRAVGAA